MPTMTAPSTMPCSSVMALPDTVWMTMPSATRLAELQPRYEMEMAAAEASSTVRL